MITNVQARMQTGANVGNECFGFANTFVYEKFKNAVQAQQMFINESEFAKAGFRGFMVNGVEFYLDAYVPGTNVSGTNDNWAVIFPKKAVHGHPPTFTFILLYYECKKYARER